MGKRDVDTEGAGPTSMWIKIWEEYLKREESQPYNRPPSPRFLCQEDKSPQFLVVKTSRD